MALNSRLSWLVGIWIILLALCFASTTQAGTRMYTGSLIIHSFGNDTTGGVKPYDTGFAVGIPLTGQCHKGLNGMGTFHAKETLTFVDPPGSPGVTVTFTIPDYGGNVAELDTNGDGIPDVPFGCGPATIEAGDPLLGSGPVDTAGATGVMCTPGPCTNPRQITMPPWALRMQKSGASFEQYGVYKWEVHFADLHNDAGILSKGGGDGSFGPFVHNKKATKRSVQQKAGANKFGGVMRLLGSYGDNEGYYYAGGATTSVFYYNWLFHYLGDGGQPGGPPITAGVYTTYVAYGHTRVLGGTTTSTAQVEVFKWTTGTVTVTAKGGTFPTVLQRKGYDKRNAAGSGAVQLVSPMLTKWTGAGTSATAAIGIMKLNFAPEPSEWMLLSSGISMLGLLAWRRSRRP